MILPYYDSKNNPGDRQVPDDEHAGAATSEWVPGSADAYRRTRRDYAIEGDWLAEEPPCPERVAFLRWLGPEGARPCNVHKDEGDEE